MLPHNKLFTINSRGKKATLAVVIPWHRSSRTWRFPSHSSVSLWLAQRDNKPVLSVSFCVSGPPAQFCELSAVRGKGCSRPSTALKELMVSVGDGHGGTEHLLKGVYEVSPYLGECDLSCHEAGNRFIWAF